MGLRKCTGCSRGRRRSRHQSSSGICPCSESNSMGGSWHTEACRSINHSQPQVDHCRSFSTTEVEFRKHECHCVEQHQSIVNPTKACAKNYLRHNVCIQSSA